VAAVKQFVGFSQNVSIINLTKLAWPEVYRKLMTVFKFASLDLEVTAPECFGAFDWHQRFAATLGLFGGAALALGAMLAVARRWRARAAAEKLKRVLVLLFTAAYTAVAMTCVQSFQSLNDGRSFVHDPSIDFRSPAHRAVMAVAGTVLALCLAGVPLGVALLARRLLKGDRLRDPEVKSAYGGLCPSLLTISP